MAATTAPPAPARKVLLIGWDAADWKTINRLVDAGGMPITKGLVERGISMPSTTSAMAS